MSPRHFFLAPHRWLFFFLAFSCSRFIPCQADEQALAEINAGGGTVELGEKTAPGVLQIDEDSGNSSAFALVRDAKDRLAVAGGTTGAGRALAFSHGSFLKQASDGETSPRLAAWMLRSLRWLGGSETPAIGIQASANFTAAQQFLETAGFTVEVFSPSELSERKVDVYCVGGHDGNLSDDDFSAISGFVSEGGGVAVFATPWPFLKKFPDFQAEFPGNRILAGTGIAFLPRGYANARPLTLVAPSTLPAETTAMPVKQDPASSEEKSDLDQLLERTYPMPEFRPLLELVENWDKVPEGAFPPQITVKVALEYQKTVGGKVVETRTANSGHQVKPLSLTEGNLSVGAGDWQAVVAVDETDFKAEVAKLYETRLAEARSRVLAQREQMKLEVADLAAMEQDRNAPTGPITRTPLTSTVAANYGKGFRGDYMPEIANGKNIETHHEIALGPLGGKAAVGYDKKEATIIELWDKGPGAEGGLQEGDVIISVNDRPLKTYSSKSVDGPTGAPEQLGLAMIEAQASGRALDLTVSREGEEENLQIELPALPPFSDDYPANCERSAAFAEAAAQWLADNQNDAGLWRSNDYSCAWCALALLATGDAKYSRQIRKAARAFADEYAFSGEPSEEELIRAGGDARSNWKTSMVGIFLGEYYLATGDGQVMDALLHCARRMEARLHGENGRLGHSENLLPYSEKGLVIVNVHAHLLWALAAHASDMEWNWEPWDLSFQAVEASIGRDNGVGYNFSARGGSQCGSRTGAMVTAHLLADRETSTARKTSSWLKENCRQFPNTHAMTSLGLIYGVMGLKNSAPSSYRKCMDDYRWMFSLVQPANFDHGSYYYGQRKNHGGDGYCNYRLVANYTTLMLLSSHRDDTLWMFGNRKRNWLE